jgi:2-iminobutanoate/2-iminopropanoate deaminase
MNQIRKVISTDKAPGAIGPYSAGIATQQFVFSSGQLGIDPMSGKLVSGGIQAETNQALENLRAVLEAGDSALNLVVKTTVFLQDISDFNKMNEIYAKFFNNHPPARSAFQVGALPKGALVEIEAIALKKT